MTEVAFAQSFLATLDSRPIKLSADHVEDPKNFPARSPYILSRMPKPMSKPKKLAPGQERTVKVTLKSLRNPPLDIKLSSQPPHTSILDIKTQVTAQTRIPAEKIKVLHNKKPVSDSKVLKDVIGEDDVAVEFSVMIIGGAAAIPPEETAAPPSAKETGASALETDEFWTDLQGFLMQRLKDESEANELSTLFKSSWESSRSKP